MLWWSYGDIERTVQLCQECQTSLLSPHFAPLQPWNWLTQPVYLWTGSVSAKRVVHVRWVGSPTGNMHIVAVIGGCRNAFAGTVGPILAFVA